MSNSTIEDHFTVFGGGREVYCGLCCSIGQPTFDADTFERHLVSRTQDSLENLVLNVGPGVIVTPMRSSIRALARLRHLKLATALCIGMELQVPRLYPLTGKVAKHKLL